jgi:hypothetical protein
MKSNGSGASTTLKRSKSAKVSRKSWRPTAAKASQGRRRG